MINHFHPYRRVVAASTLTGAAVLAGCGSDDDAASDDTAAAPTTESPAGPHRRSRSLRSMAAMAAASLLLLGACSDGDDGGIEGSPSDLVGTWEHTDFNVTWEVTDEVIATTFGGGIETAYTATDTTLEMGEESGAMACSSGQIGVYEWEIEDDVLTMMLVSDDCGGRGGIVDGISLQRVE
jgi:hypothetical protein